MTRFIYAGQQCTAIAMLVPFTFEGRLFACGWIVIAADGERCAYTNAECRRLLGNAMTERRIT